MLAKFNLCIKLFNIILGNPILTGLFFEGFPAAFSLFLTTGAGRLCMKPSPKNPDECKKLSLSRYGPTSLLLFLLGRPASFLMLLTGRCPVLFPRRGWCWNPPCTRNPAGQTVGSAERATSSVTTGRLIFSVYADSSSSSCREPSSRDSVSAPVSRTGCTDVSCKDSQLQNSSSVQ